MLVQFSHLILFFTTAVLPGLQPLLRFLSSVIAWRGFLHLSYVTCFLFILLIVPVFAYYYICRGDYPNALAVLALQPNFYPP